MNTIIINGIRCVVQSYLKNDYVNLSPIQDFKKTPFDKQLGNVRITFYNNKISTEGKETQHWKEFTGGIDIEAVKAELKPMFN